MVVVNSQFAGKYGFELVQRALDELKLQNNFAYRNETSFWNRYPDRKFVRRLMGLSIPLALLVVAWASLELSSNQVNIMIMVSSMLFLTSFWCLYRLAEAHFGVEGPYVLRVIEMAEISFEIEYLLKRTNAVIYEEVIEALQSTDVTMTFELMVKCHDASEEKVIAAIWIDTQDDSWLFWAHPSLDYEIKYQIEQA